MTEDLNVQKLHFGARVTFKSCDKISQHCDYETDLPENFFELTTKNYDS